VTESEFAAAFLDALVAAVRLAEQRFGVSLPRPLRVRLYAAGHPGDLLDVASAAQALYLGEERFYRVIDVAVLATDTAGTTVFTRASDHKPGPWSQTWEPAGRGPFKVMYPARPG
jgi:hypothetical protein